LSAQIDAWRTELDTRVRRLRIGFVVATVVVLAAGYAGAMETRPSLESDQVKEKDSRREGYERVEERSPRRQGSKR
jgi:hypothetical protein